MPFPQLHNRSHKTILVVDDDDGIRESLRLLLEMEGYLVFTASSGQECLDRLASLNAQHAPCLVICDLMMPGMSGEEVANALNEKTTFISLPIAIMTASTLNVRGRKMIRKPFNIDAVLRIVHEACEQNPEVLFSQSIQVCPAKKPCP